MTLKDFHDLAYAIDFANKGEVGDKITIYLTRKEYEDLIKDAWPLIKPLTLDLETAVFIQGFKVKVEPYEG